jgi:hypothetical protein
MSAISASVARVRRGDEFGNFVHQASIVTVA